MDTTARFLHTVRLVVERLSPWWYA